MDKKIFAGVRVRLLRQSLRLSQAAMAAQLGISPSYLNLVERNQRPLTAQLLLRLAQAYDLDLRELSGENQARLAAELTEALADPLFNGKRPQPSEIMEVAGGSPAMAEAFLALYRAYFRADSAPRTTQPAQKPRESDDPSPHEEVHDLFNSRPNYVGRLDDAAEAFSLAMGQADDLMTALRRHLQEQHGIRVSVLPMHAMPGMFRRYDHHTRRLFLSELLPLPSRIFQVAVQVALKDQSDAIDHIIGETRLSSDDARRLYRIGLANYFAGALMMPYAAFLDSAEKLRYDVVLLAARFGCSIEQVAHRLTTLHRPGRPGIPFFFLRLDAAGNVSKRLSAGRFVFSRFGGTCPRWRIHEAFAHPGQAIVHPVQMPDGAAYLTVSRTVEAVFAPYPEQPRRLAVSIGCDIAHAGRVVYADGLDLAEPAGLTPIGITCRTCERPNCPARVLPPMNRPIIIDASRKNITPFEFSG